MSASSLKNVLFGSPLRIAALVSVLVIAAAAAIGTVILSMPGSYEFPQNQKISASSPLRFSFPETMNHDSVEQHLKVPDTFQYTKSWDDETLILRPKAPLARGSVIVVTLAGQALKSDGSVLGKDMKFTFTVAGAPVLAAAIPAPDSVSVPTDADILLVFDRPVIPLTQVQGDASQSSLKELPVKIFPELSGRWRWLGTTTAQFHPDKGLTPATRYTVTVPPGIRTVGGDVTEKDLSWSFETERPRVLSSDPSEGFSSAGSTTLPTFTFNTPIDLISAKDMVKLFRLAKDGKTSPVTIGTVKYGTHDDESGKAVTDRTVVVTVPSSPLLFSASYVAGVDAGIRGLRGSLGSGSGYTVHFSTVGEFKVIGVSYDHGMVTIDFSSPVSNATLSDVLSFDPPVDVSKIVGTTYETNGCEMGDNCAPDLTRPTVQRLTFYPELKPSTRYTLKMLPALADNYGQHLRRPYSHVIQTPPVDPEVFIYPRGNNFSIFEAGKPPVYFLNNVNVSSLSVEFGRMNFEQFLSVRKTQISGNNASVGDLKSIVDQYRQVTLKPAGRLNGWESKKVDLEKTFGKIGPGIYATSVTAPEWVDPRGQPLREQRFFVLTNMAITLKYSGNRMLAWVTDLRTGVPVSGAFVKVRAVSGNIPATGTTDKNGFFEAPLPLRDMKNTDNDWMPEFWVTVEKDSDFAFVSSNWNNGIQPYDFSGINADFRSPMSPPNRMLSVLYTERPLYGAGDTVYYKGIARVLSTDGKIAVPEASRSIEVVVTDPVGTVLLTKTLKMNEFGGFSGSFPIAKEAPLGQYSIQAKMIPDADVESYSWASFSVLAYRKPEYKASVSTDKDEYVGGEKAGVTVSGQYYFGAPMAGASVAWRLMTSNYYFNKYTDGWYSFALEDAWCWRNCDRGENVVSDGKGTLDSAGLLKFQLPLSIEDKPVSQLETIEADLTDKNNQVVSTRSYVVVHKSEVYVGIASDDYAVTAGQKAAIKLITLTPQGKPAPGTRVDVSLFGRKWNVVKTKGVDGQYYYDSKPEDTFIRTESVVTGGDGKAKAQLLLTDGGEYRVIASAKDKNGHEAKAGWSLYAFADAYFNWPRTNNDRIDIVTDKPSYKIGDTAKLIVKTPFQGKGVKALVTIERDEVIEKRVVDVKSNALPIEVQIKDNMIPVAYVSVVIFKPRIGETFDDNGVDAGAPAFKIGYARLSIDTAPKKIDLTVETDKEKYLPGDTVHVKLMAKDASGRPVQTDVSLGVVDLSLLDLTGFSLPDIVTQFYSERGVGIQTANMLLYLMERFKPGSKGGGGDSGAGKTRGTFKDTAYWNPSIVTGKDGAASVTFTLPDNLTTWQLLAIGSTKDSLFGSFAKNIVETKRVILRPVRPRFAVRGDKITLGAIVHNFLEKDAPFKVSLKTEGMTGIGSAEQTVTIPKGSDLKVEFPVTVDDVTGAVMHFRAETDGGNDDIVERIPVWTYGVEQTSATSGVTEDQATETATVPTLKDAPTGTLTVSAAPSLAVYLTKGLQYLNEYPYGCAEQIVSSFVPDLALKQLQGFGQFRAVDNAMLEKNILSGLQKLYGFQNADGGFPYFGGGISFPYLTAYVLDSLRITRDTGYGVDSGVIDRATSYLKSVIASRDGGGDTLDPPARAYVLYVLSEFGSSDVASLNVLLKHPETLPVFARAYIAMAYQKAGSADKAKSVLTGILNSAKVDARSAHFEEGDDSRYFAVMNTDTRTSAIVMQALVRIEPDNALVPKIIRGILMDRHDGHWDSTQTTAQVILAFVGYLKATNELSYDYRLGIDVGDRKVLDARFKSPRLERKEVTKTLDELSRGSDVSVKVGKTGQGKLYYDVALQYFYTPDQIQPAEEGMGILRETKPLTPSDAGMKVGSTQKVTLTITVPETRHFVAVESMLPAGFEPIDLQYVTSQQGLLQNAANAAATWEGYWKAQAWRFTHIEYRDDRIFLFADELPPGVYKYEYLVRATTPGMFRERPARVFEMYSPETFGQTAGGWLQIKE